MARTPLTELIVAGILGILFYFVMLYIFPKYWRYKNAKIGEKGQ